MELDDLKHFEHLAQRLHFRHSARALGMSASALTRRLQAMEADVDPFQNNNPEAAAYAAMDNPNFYNVTLKNFAAPWQPKPASRPAQPVRAPAP